MWLLQNDTGNIFYIRGDKAITVGRKKADLLLTDDNSISKTHCLLQIQRNQDTSQLIVKDAKSKYGSSIVRSNSTINIKDNEHELKHMDKIKFGLQAHIFTVIEIPFIICISQLNKEDTTELEKLIKIIDATVVNKWRSDCTHLITSKPTLTPKVVHALIANLPIVDMRYWKECIKAIENNTKIPKVEPYILEIKDNTVGRNITLLPRPERKKLFLNMKFISFSKRQYKHYYDIITSAGGQIIIYDILNKNKNIDFNNDKLIVLQLTTEGTQYNDDLIREYMVISKIMSQRNQRIVSETEIPLAILCCSVKQHCNPSYDFRQLLTKSNWKNQELQNSSLLAQDTQDVFAKNKNFSEPSSIIKETCDDPLPETQSQSQSKKSTNDSDKTELRSRLQINSGKNDKVTEVIPETQEMHVSVIASGSTNKSTKTSFNNCLSNELDISNFKNIPCSTQKSQIIAETPRSMEVEYSEIKINELESLFNDTDDQHFNLWRKDTKTQKELSTRSSTNASSKRKRPEEDIQTNEPKKNSIVTERDNLLSKKQKVLSELEQRESSPPITKDQEIEIFDDWGLEDDKNFEVDLQKFGFVVSDKEQQKKKDNNHFEIRIEKRNVPKVTENEPVSQFAIPSTSKVQLTEDRNHPENRNKRHANSDILNTNPEKRRKIENTRNSDLVEQVTRNIGDIKVDENNFIITTDGDFCTRYDQNMSLFRTGYERALRDQVFVKQFKKAYSMPIERIHL